MKTTLLVIPFLLAVALVFYVGGSFGGFEIWNALPVVASFGVLLAGRRSTPAVMVGCTAFAASATLFVTLFHLSWLFDWGGTATSSSTSALAFIFVPIWAFILASIVGVLAWGITRIFSRNRVAR